VKSKARISLFVVIVVVGLVLPFAQAAFSTATYDAIWAAFAVSAAAAIGASLWIPRLLTGKQRQNLVALRKAHPGEVAELAAVWGEGAAPFVASVLVYGAGILVQSPTGVSRQLTWSQVRGLKSVPYGQTIRVGMEVSNDGAAICLMPVSTITLLPLSLSSAEHFFDAIRQEWRNHGAIAGSV
jgi:hypothetical protein